MKPPPLVFPQQSCPHFLSSLKSCLLTLVQLKHVISWWCPSFTTMVMYFSPSFFLFPAGHIDRGIECAPQSQNQFSPLKHHSHLVHTQSVVFLRHKQRPRVPQICCGTTKRPDVLFANVTSATAQQTCRHCHPMRVFMSSSSADNANAKQVFVACSYAFQHTCCL